MKGLIINHDTKYIGNLLHLFKGCDVMNFANFDETRAESYDYIVLSGGPNVVQENIKDEMNWLKETNKPILGVCLGLQILCMVFGENLPYNKFPQNRKLYENFKFVDTNYNMFYNHSYYFNRLPDSFIGEVKDNIVTYMKHKTRPILAFQGHPEMTEHGEMIRDFFIEKIVK